MPAKSGLTSGVAIFSDGAAARWSCLNPTALVGNSDGGKLRAAIAWAQQTMNRSDCSMAIEIGGRWGLGDRVRGVFRAPPRSRKRRSSASDDVYTTERLWAVFQPIYGCRIE